MAETVRPGNPQLLQGATVGLRELLAEGDKHPGHRSGGSVVEPPAPLKALGLSKQESSRWQLEALVPEDLFERYDDACWGPKASLFGRLP
jgi:hypothetical protein